MPSALISPEPTILRRVFAGWSITVPAAFEEAFVTEGNYWHAWDEHRSVSLTSIRITDRKNRPVRAGKILQRMPPIPGKPTAMPPGLEGWARVITTPPGSRAARAVSGLVAIDGAVLIATVTSDDLAWATTVWQSMSRVRSTRGIAS